MIIGREMRWGSRSFIYKLDFQLVLGRRKYRDLEVSISMVGLTSIQKKELHTAILEYLQKHGFQEAAQAFIQEAQVEPLPADASSLKRDLLEKKWTTVARLKR